MAEEVILHVKEEETSGSQTNKTLQDGQTKVPTTNLLELIKDKQQLLAALERVENNEQAQATIQKVPKIMREKEDIKKYFMPREISIGPLHANDPYLSKGELKLKLAKDFIACSEMTVDTLIDEIKNQIQDIRKCFGEGVIDPERYNDDSLASLLFLDGCVVLQFIFSYTTNSLKEFKINENQAALIAQDLLLLENQIPFTVLKLLMDSIKNGNKPFFYSFLVGFVLRNNICAPTNEYHYLQPKDFKEQIEVVSNKSPPVHLLDLLRTVSIFGSVKQDEDVCVNKKLEALLYEQNLTSLDDIAFKLEEVCNDDQQSFRNVQELKLSGIKMMPSNSRNLKSISFSTHCLGIRGHLKLPTLLVNGSTMRKLFNLVAYEMFLDDGNKQRVTSYLAFMDLLIDTKDDVKDLRAAQILRNPLGSDAEVAGLFNMTGSTYLSNERDYYRDIKDKIEEHYNKRRAIWIAEAYNKYFSNPWTIIAFLGALLALILTCVQTFYAINPRG